MILFVYILFTLFYPEEEEFKLENGDLIFQEACIGDADNTIKEVTSSIDDYLFTHVGIVYIDNRDSVYVLEATRPEVKLTPIQEYLCPKIGSDCSPKSVVGRLTADYQSRIPKALEIGLTLLGKGYDDGFILDNDEYYCSELVYEILKEANDGVPVFSLNIMTFKSQETGEITQGWIEYFDKYKLPIPEGELGINPGSMSKSNAITIVHRYDSTI